MARMKNDMYIGHENFNLEYSNIKHPSTITYFNNVNINKIKSKKISLIGLDLETNHLTSQLKLLGFWDGKEYEYHTNNFIGALFNKIKYCSKNAKSIAYWNKLDPFVLYKQFLLLVDEKDQKTSLERFGKISGRYNNKEKVWEEEPIIKIKLANFEFGILNIIRSSIQFYYISKYKGIINKVWSYDIASLYGNNLSKEGERFNYYSKVDKSAHLVDWNKFKEDRNYRENIVLKSNYLDSRVVRDLGLLVQDNFKKVFKHYPNTLISSGSLTRSAIVAEVYNKYKIDFGDTENELKKLRRKVFEEVKSIPISNYYNEWLLKYGQDLTKELFCIANESYSGGYIETLQFGYIDKAFMSDIASAYPSKEVQLYDLRDAKITEGYGIPPKIKNSYCFIRGDIDVPLTLNFNPITIKHPFSNITNIRGVGEYRASYLLESRELLLKNGCKFSNEYWINIETTGKISTFAMAVNSFLEMRKYFLKVGDDAQQLAKDCANSGYGISYECTPVYEIIDGKIVKTGYRGGEFYNPIYASVITALVRNQITECALAIEKNGGEILLIMTDSLFWNGTITDLPSKYWREEKTLGFFEKPIQVNKFMCLGSGRYEYYLGDDKYKGKTRGISIAELLNENGVVMNSFNWRSLVYKAEAQNTNIINVNTRILVSPPLVLNFDKYKVEDLGLVKTENREIDILAGKSKRMIHLKDDWLSKISKELLKTKPLYLFRGMDGENHIQDFTLPNYRRLVKLQDVKNKEERQKLNKQKQNERYREINKEKINKKRREKYALLRKYGFDTKISKIYSKKNYKEVYELIGGKIV